jgi:DNA replication and repair protein RecF
MSLTGVRLQRFRSYQDQAFELEPGVNIVVGPNASGKTNLLEALYVAARGKSFRARDLDLIAHGKSWARIDINSQPQISRTVKLRRRQAPLKEFMIGANQRRRLPAQELLPVVLFTPDDLRLLNGSPHRRREYLDQLLVKLEPTRATTVSRYQRALLQRNALLKDNQPDRDELFVWGVKLGELGGQIADWRRQLIKQINRLAGESYSELAGGKHRVRLIYLSDLSGKGYQHALNAALQSGRDQTIGHTSAGPHRDDFRLVLNGRDSAATASRGEVRTLVLVTKLVEAKLLEERFEQKPLLLLDDVFSELDGKRRRQLANAVAGYQTLITTTDADVVIEHFATDTYNAIAL